jgi:hypothetical protein
MTPEQAAAAGAQGRVAEARNGDIYVHPDLLNMPPEQLGGYLLHEFTHTGQPTTMGFDAFGEGVGYGVEYFYAQANGDTARMNQITNVISQGAIVLPAERAGLQQQFQETVTVLDTLHDVIAGGGSSQLPSLDPPLSSAEAERMLVDYISNGGRSGDPRMQQIIDHVHANLGSYYKGPPL